ncbi:MAG: methyltransferase domain-containing protein [Planctomycetaceae bacterium]
MTGGNGTSAKDSASSNRRARSLNVDSAVRDRYSSAAAAPEQALCCPVNYDARYLEVIPDEVIERDYGCGDPSQHVQPGDVVLDLGSGGGKICFICAQIVGPNGRVIGIDCNDEMLVLARRHRPTVAERIGYDNVEFRKGRIQDLKLDLDQLEAHLAAHPVTDSTAWLHAHEIAESLRESSPLVADESVDVVISNCAQPGERRPSSRTVRRGAPRPSARRPRGHQRHRLR